MRSPDPSPAGLPATRPFPRLTLRAIWRWRWRVLLGVGVLGLLVWGGSAFGVRTLVDQLIARLREAGAPLFFAAMALLPAVGFPLLPFAVAAGPVFGPTLGTPGVVACAVLAVLVNVTLTYALASTWLRPFVAQLMARLGYHLPAPRRDGAWGFITLVRLAPGLPFWAQSYLLGLMRVRLGPYLVVSTLVPAAYLTGTIVFGDALLHGDAHVGVLALAALGLVGVFIFLIRRRLQASAALALVPLAAPPVAATAPHFPPPCSIIAPVNDR